MQMFTCNLSFIYLSSNILIKYCFHESVDVCFYPYNACPGCYIQGGRGELMPGDFYLTRHSNLSEVHMVFHLVTNDSTRGDISSRHPAILALRNIVKHCFRYDINTITIPLLLAHEMREVGWLVGLPIEKYIYESTN